MKIFLSRLFDLPRIWAILLFALITGSILYFAVPPWWHYDEPAQFEYAWLLANDPQSTHDDKGNPEFRRVLAKSLDEYGWYDVRNYKPKFESSDPIWIGTSQVGDKITTGYYYFLSLPLRLLKNASVITQYQVSRLISLLIFLATIFLAVKISEMLFASGSPLRWMVPVFLATLPGFIDMMLSVSNDVAAVFSFSLFLYASIRLFYHRRVTLLSIILLLVALIFCAFAKNVTWFALVLAPLVIILRMVPKRYYLWMAVVLITIFIILLPLSFDLQGAKGWFIQKATGTQSRKLVSEALDGRYAWSEKITPSKEDGVQGQCIAPDIFSNIKEKQITYGSWIWADSTLEINAPILRFFDGRVVTETHSPEMSVSSTPRFFRFVTEVPDLATRVCVIINPKNFSNESNNIYYDGFVLVDGVYSDSPPYLNPDLPSVTWDGKPVQNLIFNGSYEQGGFRIKSWVEKLAQKIPIVKGRLSFTIFSLITPNSFGWFYKNSAEMMFRTFWADIAGNKVILPGRYTYQVIFLVFIIGILGALLSFWRNRSNFRWDVGLLFLSSIILIMGANLFQSAAPLLESDAMSSFARHNFPIIIPIATLLCIGWREWLCRFDNYSDWNKGRSTAIFFTFMIGLLIGSLYSCLSYFHPSLLDWFLIILFMMILIGLYQIISWILNTCESSK